MTTPEEIAALKRAYDQIPQILFVLDVLEDKPKRDRFQFLLLNRTYEKEVGLKHSDITLRTPRQCFDISTALEIERHYQDCVDAGKEISYDEGLVLAGEFNIWLTTLTPEIKRDRVVRILGISLKQTPIDEVEQSLRDAIADDKLTLYYQPIRRLDNCALVGYEALLRWPESGLSPDKFLPVAQRGHMMRALNALVISKAAKQASQLPKDIWVSVNLSEFNVVQIIEDAIAAEGISRSQLGIEILENTNITNAIAAEISSLKDLGHGVKLDDFGTQFSNSYLLKLVPCDQLKIDRRFVYLVADDPGSQAICKATLDMAAAFNLSVIAEGIERDEDWQWLLLHGCQYGQGYHPLLGKPTDLN